MLGRDARIEVAINQSPDSFVRADLFLTIDDTIDDNGKNHGGTGGEFVWINQFPETLLALAETIRRAWNTAEKRGLFEGLDSIEIGQIESGKATRVRSSRRREVTPGA